MREALKNHILNNSTSKNINEAIKEWYPTTYDWSEEGKKCPCGQTIHQICFIKNKNNDIETYVGNSCVNNFMGITTDPKVFNALKKITNTIDSKPNLALFEYALNQGFLKPTEHSFYKNLTKRTKKPLTIKQKNWLTDINRRILMKKTPH